MIVCDLFPHHQESAYFSDMTRTFTVGTPDPEIVEWHGFVREALELSREMVRAGTNGGDVHRAVCAFFEERGQPTHLSAPEGTVLRDGFYHGLGHGVGLDVHESPSLGRIGHELVAGDVITLEPGLYRHGFGGVRLEDILLVTDDGWRRSRASRTTSIRRSPPWRSRDERPGDRDPARRGAAVPARSGLRRAGERPDALYDAEPEAFWAEQARARVTWFDDFHTVSEWELPYAKWFLGGTLNVAYNCVDRHVEAGLGDRVAYLWEGEPEDDRRTITYADLQRRVVAMANALKELGVGKGTKVAIYLGMVPSVAIAMLACTRLGAPHTVVFGGFSADSLSDRVNDMGCEVLVTQDEAWRRGSTVPLKRTADEAMAAAPKVRACLVVRRTGNEVPMQEGRDHWYHDSTSRTTRRRAHASRWTARTCCS